MPASPAASRNCTSSVLFAAGYFSTCSTSRVSVGLVVSEVGVQGQQAAVFVVQAAWCAGGDHVEHRLIVLQLVPLRIAFTEAYCTRWLSNASELVESTPGKARNCQSRASTLARMS